MKMKLNEKSLLEVREGVYLNLTVAGCELQQDGD